MDRGGIPKQGTEDTILPVSSTTPKDDQKKDLDN